MSRSSQFEKFFVDKKNNAAVKEQFKQEKKKEKKERAAAIDKYYDEKRKQKALAREQASKPAAAAAPVRGTNASKKTGKQGSSTPKAQQEISSAESVDLMPLNKYVAHSGVCARREAAILVKEGKVSVNGQVITEPGFKVSEKDLVKVNDKKITPSRNFVYILLNKPKDYITTNDDPQGRKTVLELVKHATTERVYPVGRLDRNTSGVLLLTNDGELAQKLSHPKHEIKKIYEVHLDKSLTKGDFDKIMSGLTLEDGFIVPDSMAYADPKDKTIIGIEIHSGRNRIVRRIFEHLNYDVRALDRVMYAGLTKKNVQRGKWRLLLEKEVRILKHFNKQKPVK
jgi:23S rRNA pseudouridine2605 synthase